MELFHALGLDIRILIAQLINFAVLIFVLHRFAYRPILNLLEDRKRKIEEGLRNMDKSREVVEEATRKAEAVIAEARQEARTIAARAEEAAKKHQEKVFADTQLETARLISLAKKKMDAERIRLVAEARAELSEVVVAAVENIIREKLDSERDRELIQKSLSEVRLEK